MNEELGGYITRLFFNDESQLQLNKNDIVVFVGPNNVGKSQSLKDIYLCCQSNKQEGVVVKNISLKTSTEGLNGLLSRVAVYDKSFRVYRYLSHSLHDIAFNDNSRFKELTYLFVSFLKTEDRLTYCKPQPNINKGDNMTHPMQYLIDDKHYRKKLSNLFYKAFQEKLYCYTRGKDISIRNGIIEDTVVNGDKMDVVDSVFEEIGVLPHIENQGDGMRSFVSILLSLGLDYKRIHLFDEPESFLHQAQARIMGRMIGEELNNNQQAFISTHSTDLIKGLLEKAESRVKIIRITREGSTNRFHVLDNNKIQDICNDEMLKHSNLLEGLFNNKVVVCESDVDCLLYSSIEEYLLNQQGKYSDSFYLFTGGKSSFKKTLIALIGLGISYRAILDLDALNDEAVIKGIYEACGGNWDKDIKNNYDIFINWANHQGSHQLTKEEAKTLLNASIDKCSNEYLSPNDLRNIKSCLKSGLIWERIKQQGRNVISDESVLCSFDSILNILKNKNIFLVPVGEIESFFPDIDGHSHGWLQKVFKAHPTFDDPAYATVRRFVELFQ